MAGLKAPQSITVARETEEPISHVLYPKSGVESVSLDANKSGVEEKRILK